MRRLGDGYTVRFAFPLVGNTPIGRRAYGEYWLTVDASRVRWVQYRGPQGAASGLRAAGAMTVPVKDPSYIRPPGESDPASAFRTACAKGQLQSRGAVTFGAVAAWRFTAHHGKHGLQEEWIVDRQDWLPLRYRYVDHNHYGSIPVTNTLTMRFLEFEALPLNAQTRPLLQLTPDEQRVAAGDSK